MQLRSRFSRLDAFTKTVEDARVRTSSGGVVTIVSLILMLWLVWGEWTDYRRVVMRPELVVDTGRDDKMEIHMNVSFPRIPCDLLTLDVMDVSGEIQAGVVHGIKKVRLAPEGRGGYEIETNVLELHSEEAKHLDPDYCGDCYGTVAPASAVKPNCCNTCEEVREAYSLKSWSFGRGENVEQCQREHYAERLEKRRQEGCRVEGGIYVNKVIGNFHFAPGRSYSNGNMHVHDLENYIREASSHSFTHNIHSLRFGPALPEDLTIRLKEAGLQSHLNPLEGAKQETSDANFNFIYFIKVVSTVYLPLGWEKENPGYFVDADVFEAKDGGLYGAAGSIETNQYSVTSHKRSLRGGIDDDEGHKSRIHARGGLPGVFFSYDISPMKVINREAHVKSFSAFLVGVCAVVGGTFTVASAVDRALYEGARKVKKLHQG